MKMSSTENFSWYSLRAVSNTACNSISLLNKTSVEPIINCDYPLSSSSITHSSSELISLSSTTRHNRRLLKCVLKCELSTFSWNFGLEDFPCESFCFDQNVHQSLYLLLQSKLRIYRRAVLFFLFFSRGAVLLDQRYFLSCLRCFLACFPFAAWCTDRFR